MVPAPGGGHTRHPAVLTTSAPLRDPNARPGTVLAAGITTLVTSALVLLRVAAFTVILAASVVVIVCLFTGGAGAWYRREQEPPAPGMVRC